MISISGLCGLVTTHGRDLKKSSRSRNALQLVASCHDVVVVVAGRRLRINPPSQGGGRRADSSSRRVKIIISYRASERPFETIYR